MVQNLLGSPMVLSLLAPLLAERGEHVRIDTGRWDHYVGKLRDRKYTQMRRQGSYNYETINEAISISFDQLDPDTRLFFNDFVIFLDDVNIPSAVISCLISDKSDLIVCRSYPPLGFGSIVEYESLRNGREDQFIGFQVVDCSTRPGAVLRGALRNSRLVTGLFEIADNARRTKTGSP